MPRRTRRVAIVLFAAATVLPSRGWAGSVLAWTESGRRDGREWSESSEARIGRTGVRIRETKGGESTPYLTMTYRCDERTLYLQEGAAPPIPLSTARLDQLEALPTMGADSAPRPGSAAAPPQPALAPLGLKEQVAGHACSTYVLHRAGLRDRNFCLAAPADLGLSAADIAMLREMIDLVQRLGRIGHRMAPPPADAPPAPDDSLNPYAFAEGMPLRIWETAEGKTAWESRVTSLRSAEVPESELAPEPRPPQ